MRYTHNRSSRTARPLSAPLAVVPFALLLCTGCAGALAADGDDAGDATPWWLVDAGDDADDASFDANANWDAWQAESVPDSSLGCESTCAGTCFLSTCILTIADNQATPTSMAADDKYIYWTNAGDGTVMRASQGGGGLATLASGQGTPFGIALGDAGLYWAALDDAGTEDIMFVPWGGGPVKTVIATSSGAIPFAVNQSGIYWPTWNGFTATIYRADLDGANASAIGHDDQIVGAIVADSNNVYWTTPGSYTWVPPIPPGAPTGGGGATEVYSGGAVRAAATSGAGQAALAVDQPVPGGLTVTTGGTVAYLADGPIVPLTTVTGDVMAVAADGTGAPSPIALETNGGVEITSQGEMVYWTGAYGVSKVAESGGVVSRLGYVTTGATVLAVGSTKVFWAEPGDDAGACSVELPPCAGPATGKIYAAPK